MCLQIPKIIFEHDDPIIKISTLLAIEWVYIRRFYIGVLFILNSKVRNNVYFSNCNSYKSNILILAWLILILLVC